ncbi:hypothetical protein K456DRAFT_55165 [Colletotrichum gloeosporioides 23]|nr:hypothetical protein K456DRAFT_55165 [Colletotrichum gloeosporioides 23]
MGIGQCEAEQDIRDPYFRECFELLVCMCVMAITTIMGFQRLRRWEWCCRTWGRRDGRFGSKIRSSATPVEPFRRLWEGKGGSIRWRETCITQLWGLA